MQIRYESLDYVGTVKDAVLVPGIANNRVFFSETRAELITVGWSCCTVAKIEDCDINRRAN